MHHMGGGNAGKRVRLDDGGLGWLGAACGRMAADKYAPLVHCTSWSKAKPKQVPPCMALGWLGWAAGELYAGAWRGMMGGDASCRRSGGDTAAVHGSLACARRAVAQNAGVMAPACYARSMAAAPSARQACWACYDRPSPLAPASLDPTHAKQC